MSSCTLTPQVLGDVLKLITGGPLSGADQPVPVMDFRYLPVPDASKWICSILLPVACTNRDL